MTRATAIRLVDRVRVFADKHRDQQLLPIAEDGMITAQERPLFDEIMQDLDDLIRVGTEIKIVKDCPE